VVFMTKKLSLVNAFGILWALLTPLVIHEDYPLANSLGVDIKSFYLGLYILSNLVVFLVVLANVDRNSQQTKGSN